MNGLRWFGCVGFFGFLALLSVVLGLDAASAISPTVVEVVPQLFRSQGRIVSSNIALAGNDFAAAYDDASAAMLKRPLDPEALFVAGVAANGLGKRRLAEAAISAAAGLGWRDIFAQVAVLRGAADQQQWRAAAPRVAAIVRLDRLDLLPVTAVRQIVDDPGGRRALANEFEMQPSGWSALANWIAQNLGPIELARFLTDLPDATKVTDCTSLANQATWLLGSLGYNYVDAVWSGGCVKGHSTAKVVQIPNEVTDGVVGPYDWAFPSQGAISWSVQGSEIGPVIAAVNSDPIGRVLAQRIAMLHSGLYHISISFLNKSKTDYDVSSDSGGLNVTMSCVIISHNKNSNFLNIRHKSMDSIIEVPNECPVQLISIYIPSGNYPPFRLSVVKRQ